MRPRKVLVTGSHGFLGSLFTNLLAREGVPFVGYERAAPLALDPETDTVVHFAGLTPVSPFEGDVVTDADYQTANVEFTRSFLQLLRAHENLKRLVHIGSSAEYGSSPHPLTEASLAAPIGAYGKSKLAQSALIEAFARERGVPTTNLRIFNVAGIPPESRASSRTSIFGSLVDQFTRGDTDSIRVSHPDTVRDFVAVEDILEAIWAAVQSEQAAPYELINIASGQGTRLAEVAGLFGKILNRPHTLIAAAPAPDSSIGAAQKARELLGWEATTPLAESVARMLGVKNRFLIVGAGVAGAEVIEQVHKEGRRDIWVVGLVDDDPEKRGSSVHGVPVVGTINELPQLVADLHIDQVLVSTPSVGKDLMSRVAGLLPPGFPIKVLPSISSVILGKVDLSYVRDIDPSDLIGRPLVKADQQRIAKHASGKTFLVTGGAGSIGSEIVRQLNDSGAKEVLLLDSWEEGVFNLMQELENTGSAARIRAFVGNVRDRERLDEVLSRHRVDVIVHAAAYKHVPLMEENPSEAHKTNVLGTKNVLDAAVTHGVKEFVLISTDKAVHPASVMGKSKREAELLIRDYAKAHPTHRFMAVRFGNVLNSSGSVLPKFMRQIRSRSPVTITHFEMTRYFMSIPEAVSLVLLAWVVAKNGQIALLDMGQPVRIKDLAISLIKIHGLEPYIDIPLQEVGMRPGEKIHEELSHDPKSLKPSPAERIFIAEEFL